jgi:hypothetical protein
MTRHALVIPAYPLKRSPRNRTLAAHVLTLAVGNADVESYAVDTTTGNSCPREGTLVVTAPNDSVAHELPVALPICSATISSVD